ncbi:MAG: hypothetical protein MI974_04340 [Chitinophagales bacterium]|nr:hypothetical protein [Chitinophagales bacterium]
MRLFTTLLVLLFAVSFCFANETNPPNTDPPGEERLKIKIPVFGSGGLDMNSGKICPDWCWLCKCATITLELFKVSEGTDITNESGELDVEGKKYHVTILEGGQLKEWDEDEQYEYYLDKSNSESLILEINK